MPNVDANLPKGLSGLVDLPKQREQLLNLFFNGKGIIRRPGVSTFTDSETVPVPVEGEGITRGAVKWVNPGTLTEEWYQVSAESFIKLEEDGTKTVYTPSIPGTTRVIFAKTVDFLVLITVGGNTAFYFDGTTLTAFATLPASGFRDVSVSENFFLYVTFNGSNIQVSADTTAEINTPDIVLGVFNPEDLPDKTTGIFNDNGDIFIGGTESFQLFRFDGSIASPGIPFAKVKGGTEPTGYVAGKTPYKGTFAFLGQPTGEAFGFFVKTQGDSEEISNDAVFEILNNEYTVAELQDCVGFRIFWKKVEIVLFTLARHTFGFAEGNWSLWQTGVLAQSGTANWRAAYPIFVYGKYRVGDTQNSRLGVLSNVYKEFDDSDITANLIEWRMRSFIIFNPDTFFQLNYIELDCLSGTGEIDLDVQPEEIVGVIGLTLSKDGQIFERDNEMVRSLGDLGKYQTRVRFSEYGGLGTYEKFLGYELRGTAPVNFSLEALDFGNDQ